MLSQLVSEQLAVSINDLGAEIHSIKNKQGLEFIWTAEKDIWPRHAPILFPIVGKLKNNNYYFNEKKHTLGQHGFARDMAFKLLQNDGTRCLFELTANENTRLVYPFEFNFKVGYELKQNKLHCGYKITNPAREPLFFSVGAHPGFCCPISEGEQFEDYYLEFEKDQLIQTTLKEGLRNGKKSVEFKDRKLFLSENTFDDDALVFENNQVNRILLCSTKSSNKVIMEFAGWPFFGIWAKKGIKKFICLEPWYGIADDINTAGDFQEKTGIICLQEQQEFNCDFSIEVI
jgi:galactose mutarotase-like enzyme